MERIPEPLVIELQVWYVSKRPPLVRVSIDPTHLRFRFRKVHIIQLQILVRFLLSLERKFGSRLLFQGSSTSGYSMSIYMPIYKRGHFFLRGMGGLSETHYFAYIIFYHYEGK